MDRAIVRSLEARGIDVVTVAGSGRLGRPDEQQLQFAAANGRAVFTRNIGDFTRLHAKWMRAGRHHAGIVVARPRRMSVGEQIRALARLAIACSPELMTDRLEFLTNWHG